MWARLWIVGIKSFYTFDGGDAYGFTVSNERFGASCGDRSRQLSTETATFLSTEIGELTRQGIANDSLAGSVFSIHKVRPQGLVGCHGIAQVGGDGTCGIGIPQNLSQDQSSSHDGATLATSCDPTLSEALVGRGR